MVGTKKESIYRKKRKGIFSGVQKQAKKSRASPLVESKPHSETAISVDQPNTFQAQNLPSQSQSDSDGNNRTAVSASRRKLSKQGYIESSDEEVCEQSTDDETFDEYGRGCRLIDMGCFIFISLRRAQMRRRFVFFLILCLYFTKL